MALITGDDTANSLTGTAAIDLIQGLGGGDRILAGNANDRVAGGEGSDIIAGGNGDDLLFGFAGVGIDQSTQDIDAMRVGIGFRRPVFAASAPGDDDRLYIVEAHTGQIRILDPATGQVNATPFLDIPDAQLSKAGEQGLLGLAFDPGYETNRKLYVFLTNATGDIEVRRYLRSASNPDQANPATGNVILTLDKGPAGNHNGGWMGFGPDGMLYISVGDGGGSGDPNNNAQNRDVLFGKILRLDVSRDDFAADPNRDYAIPDDNPFAGATAGADEIWSLGLRNPWRPSFDRLTGDLYIADVGQGSWEEVNFQDASRPGGANYGWKVKEGTEVFSNIPGNPSPNDPSLIDPIHQYGHGPAPDGGFAVTGGYVFRGPGDGMRGTYFFADFATNQLWSFKVVDGIATDFANRTDQVSPNVGGLSQIASFAEDGHGNLYTVQLNGQIYRLEPGAAAGDGADTIDGGTGADRIYGGAGLDRLIGGSGNDVLWGGLQKDSLNGAADNDNLRGENGPDVLLGGLGNDRLEGGAGADRFLYGAGFGIDTVADFADDIDTVAFGANLGLTDIDDALSHAFENGGNVVFNFGDGDRLIVVGTTKAELRDDIVIG